MPNNFDNIKMIISRQQIYNSIDRAVDYIGIIVHRGALYAFSFKL